MNLPERIVELRKGRFMTQKQLAEAVGVTEIAIQNYESQRRKPAYDVLLALADYFGVTLDYLTGRSPFPDYSVSEDWEPCPMLCIRMKELREKQGLSLEQLAYIIGDTERNCAGYEAGEVLPRLRTICLMADQFDVSLDYMIGRSDNPEIP